MIFGTKIKDFLTSRYYVIEHKRASYFPSFNLNVMRRVLMKVFKLCIKYGGGDVNTNFSENLSEQGVVARGGYNGL